MQASKPQSTSESSSCSASTTCPYCGVGCGVSLELETQVQEGGELNQKDADDYQEKVAKKGVGWVTALLPRRTTTSWRLGV